MFEKSYNILMASILEYLNAQPLLQVLRSLTMSPEPRHLRDLATVHSLSVAGVSDILRRLTQIGAIKETRRKNRKYFVLAIPPLEKESLIQFFVTSEEHFLRNRAIRFSDGAAEKIRWMERAFTDYRTLKGPALHQRSMKRRGENGKWDH